MPIRTLCRHGGPRSWACGDENNALSGALPFDYLCFVAVPEPKVAKNRIHWDVVAPDVSALVAAGARILREPDDDVFWHVLADPEGNEFCAFHK